MKARGIKPELEAYHTGGVWVVEDLIRQGLLEKPYWLQTVMGYQTASLPSVDHVLHLLRDMPDDSLWLCSGIGPFQLPMTTLALLMGGHARVGLEDNVYYRQGEKATGNAQLVARTVRLAHELGRRGCHARSGASDVEPVGDADTVRDAASDGRGTLVSAPHWWSAAAAVAAGGIMYVSVAPFQQTPALSTHGRFDVRVERSVFIPMRDGVELSTDLYLPAADGERLGVVLLRTPYNKKTFRARTSRAFFFASHGYAVAVQDVRGKYESEGSFTVSGSDVEDGYDTVGWLSAQPWSNGKVGTFGCSYLGDVQIMQATARHPNLAAMIPQAAGSSLGAARNRYHQFGVRLGGAFELAAAVGWSQDRGASCTTAPHQARHVTCFYGHKTNSTPRRSLAVNGPRRRAVSRATPRQTCGFAGSGGYSRSLTFPALVASPRQTSSNSLSCNLLIPGGTSSATSRTPAASTYQRCTSTPGTISDLRRR